MPLPRLLVILGSGETTPTMVKTHREVLARLGPPPVAAVVINTPFGFQENRSDLAERAVEYFRESVGQELGIAEFRSASAAATDPVGYESMLTDLRAARYVFAGPGSPSYALRQWAGSPLPDIFRSKLVDGGCIAFASAAALTLGVKTVPVYEIYKVGEEPHWLDGLDLLSETGLRAAVIPHYNNAEGGTHDTRFCYLGERRLSSMEAMLPDGCFVLGVDEHTACIFDLDARSATVTGNGVVTVRHAGRSTEVPAGSTLAIEDLVRLASGDAPVGAPPPTQSAPPAPTVARSPLLDEVGRLEDEFDAALDSGSSDVAVKAMLELDDLLVAWSRDSLQSDEMDRGRAALRGMIVKLGRKAVSPRGLLAPFVTLLLDLRAGARDTKRWADADTIRDRLVELGVEVRDTPLGPEWDLPLLS
jgi:cyanophycinase-like exopeptidase